MLDRAVIEGLQYASYAMELWLVVRLTRQGEWRRLFSLWAYGLTLLATDAVIRPYVLYEFGFRSPQYAYCYWLTDVMLAFAAFLLITSFFRRAYRDATGVWTTARRALVLVLFLVLGVSLYELRSNYDHLYTRFIIEFQQNLYFACAVLNTVLYLLMQRFEALDEELGLLVCGTGIQFAGPAANLALVYLTPHQHYASSFFTYLDPLCNLGMLAIWFYAITRLPQTERDRAHRRGPTVPVLAEVAARGV
jgi:hypothetical protein